MENETGRPPELLALLGDRRPMRALLLALEETGHRVDVATDLSSARKLFFGAGGHDCLLLAPDVTPGLAARVLRSLRDVDPELATATFGPAVSHTGTESRTATLASFHPGSRAGQGALLRFLAGLRH